MLSHFHSLDRPEVFLLDDGLAGVSLVVLKLL
jgi:hypothetical protein